MTRRDLQTRLPQPNQPPASAHYLRDRMKGAARRSHDLTEGGMSCCDRVVIQTSSYISACRVLH